MRRHRAQALVEFAFVFPIFLLLTFGLVELGRAVWHYNTLSNVAREAVRQRELAAVTSANQASWSPSLTFCDSMFVEPCAKNVVTSVPSSPPTPPDGKVLVTMANACPDAPTVFVTYSFQPLITFLWGESPAAFVLSATSATPLVPGVCPP